MFTIQWAKRAVKQLVRLHRKDRVRISAAVDELALWPECSNVNALKDHIYSHRLRVGRYRIFFEVEKQIRLISIEEVKKRDERTY